MRGRLLPYGDGMDAEQLCSGFDLTYLIFRSSFSSMSSTWGSCSGSGGRERSLRTRSSNAAGIVVEVVQTSLMRCSLMYILVNDKPGGVKVHSCLVEDPMYVQHQMSNDQSINACMSIRDRLC